MPIYPYKNRRDTRSTYEQRRVHLRIQQESSCLQQGEKVIAAQSCPTPCNPMDYTDQNTGVGSLSLLQGIFPTQGLNPGLPHCRWILYQLSHQGSPRILECIAYPFSREIFPTQGLNQGLLHCRLILYQLSYQGSPTRGEAFGKSKPTGMLILDSQPSEL